MPWITKDSANAKIETRSEPYLTDEMRKRLQSEILPRYADVRGALLPCLHEIQHAYGWVPEQAMIEIADLLGLTPADVLDSASFYEEYWLKRRGRRLIGVCRSIACEFCGQRELTDAIRDKLGGIEVGDTSEDGEFTLVELECIGACGGAPAMLVDEQLHEHVKPAEAGRILDEARKQSSGH